MSLFEILGESVAAELLEKLNSDIKSVLDKLPIDIVRGNVMNLGKLSENEEKNLKSHGKGSLIDHIRKIGPVIIYFDSIYKTEYGYHVGMDFIYRLKEEEGEPAAAVHIFRRYLNYNIPKKVKKNVIEKIQNDFRYNKLGGIWYVDAIHAKLNIDTAELDKQLSSAENVAIDHGDINEYSATISVKFDVWNR